MLPSAALNEAPLTHLTPALGVRAHQPNDRMRHADLAREGFEVGGLGLMIRYAEGSELGDVPTLHRLPHAPAWMAGMANLHGALVPVFDLALRWGLARPEQARTMLLVLGHGSDAAGIVIDGLPQRLQFDPAQPLPVDVAPPPLQGLVRAACLIGQRPWLELDVPALLSRLEAELAA